MPEPCYRGRFAPSPTGPLHFGSLVTALASYLEARKHNGAWLVRIEDLDPLRESQQAVDQILFSLEAHHLHWDEGIRFQSHRHDAYRAAIAQLQFLGRAYRCGCSRRQLRDAGGLHPFRCRQGKAPANSQPQATRFALEPEQCRWHDQLLGPQVQQLEAEVDDPVIWRKEGFFAYQLAVVVDDIDQGITDIVRGSDLLDTTASQSQIYAALAAPLPNWLHIPVILNDAGQKLSKQTHAPALDDGSAADNLWLALAALGQQPPPQLRRETPAQLLAWATEHWQRQPVPRSAHSFSPPAPPAN